MASLWLLRPRINSPNNRGKPNNRMNNIKTKEMHRHASSPYIREFPMAARPIAEPAAANINPNFDFQCSCWACGQSFQKFTVESLTLSCFATICISLLMHCLKRPLSLHLLSMHQVLQYGCFHPELDSLSRYIERQCFMGYDCLND